MSIKYSPTELSVLALLKNATEALNTQQLADLFYRDEQMRPRHAETVISNVLRSLMKATAANDEKFVIERVKLRGNEAALFRIAPKIRARA